MSELGIVLDEARNATAKGETSIQATSSRAQIWIIPTNEELVVARQAKELLTERYRLPKERLWATVFYDEDEAARLWERIAGIPPERIVRLGEKDNFWAMGDTGPCGPCSEIIIDQGEAMACGPDCGIGRCECDRYLEIWNLVFMQFNRSSRGDMEPLPKPSIDTGMGLERLCAIVQGVQSNFDTDLLRPVIARIEDLASEAYGGSDKLKFREVITKNHGVWA